MKKLNNINLKNISYLANVVLLFSIIVDSTNILFGIKDIAFIFFVIVSFPYAKFKNILIFIIFLTIYFITLAVGVLTGQAIDYGFAIGTLKSFLFLTYLFWVNDDYLQICSIFYKLTLLISIVIVILYTLILLFPFLEGPVYLFLTSSTDQLSIIAMSRRRFLGIRILYMYYRTSPLCVISLSIALFFLFSRKKIKYFFHACILFLCLFLSGARANMLAGLFIVAFLMLCYILYYKKSLFGFTAGFCIAGLSGIILIIRLLTDTERSVEIKAGHLESLLLHFSEDPIRFLFIGTGAGSVFFTKGFNSLTEATELTYLELIRTFGLIFTLVIILILCIPFINIINNKQYNKFLKISLGIGYLAYLFIAGTNPLIISSTGIVVVAVMFYISQKNILQEI